MSILRVTEIYQSIQGEGRFTGWPCVFIRTAGCPLRCRWCDTVYSFAEGEAHSEQDIVEKINAYGARHVELTGGEPLAQRESLGLMKRLADVGYTVMIETGGSIDIASIDPRVHIIMDIKCPASGMDNRNLYSNVEHLKPTDEVKFVIAGHGDFVWALSKCQEYDLFERVSVLFSPAFALIKESQLVEWILASGFPIKLNLQVHKYIWSPKAKGV